MLSPLISLAQRDVYNWQISPYGGLLTLSNDIAVPEDANSYAYGLRIERRLGNDFTLGLHLTQFKLDGAANNNISGGFLSLGYHWDNGYLFSKRSTVSIFHRLEAGYLSQYADIESINSKSSDLAFGFENGLKFRFGDRVSADVAVEILGTQSSTEGDIAKNERYNVWKVGLSYHFGSRKSNYVAPVFVPNGGFPFGSKMNKIDRKDDNIWIANDSIYNTQLKEERFPDAADGSLSTRPQVSRADSLLIFMHFDSLYQRRLLLDSTATRPDTSLLRSIVPTAISDTAFAKADSVDVGSIEKSLRDTIYMTDGDTILTLAADTLIPVRLVSDSSAKAMNEDSLLVDTMYIERPIVNEQMADTAAKGVQPVVVPMRPDTLDEQGLEQKADTSAKAVQPIPVVVPARVDTVYKERPEQRADTAAKAVQPIPVVVPARVDTVYEERPELRGDTAAKAIQPIPVVVPARVDTVYRERPEQRADTSAKAVQPLPVVVPARVDTVYKERPEQRADTSAKAILPVVIPAKPDTVFIEQSKANEQKSDSSVKARQQNAVPVRVDTVYMEKPKTIEKKTDTSPALEGKSEPSRVDTVYMVKSAAEEKSSRSDSDINQKQKKDDSDKSNEAVSKTNSSNQKSSNDNNDDYQKSITKQNNLLAEQNRQIIANQKEIERLRKENKRGDTGKLIAAGAAGTALGAIATSGNKSQTPDTVYYESVAAQQKLDSLALELAALKKQYGIVDTIAADTAPSATDIEYVPNPPIGMYFQKDSIRTDSVMALRDDSTEISNASSKMILEDSLARANEVKQAELTKPAVVVPTPKESDKNEMNSMTANKEEKIITKPTTARLIGNYPVACNFGLNKTALDAEELKKLDPIITDLKNDKSRKVLLTGYTDSSGNADYNLQLSKKRAKSVMDYLTSNGVAEDRIEIRGSGVLESADKYSANARRVDVTIGEE